MPFKLAGPSFALQAAGPFLEAFSTEVHSWPDLCHANFIIVTAVGSVWRVRSFSVALLHDRRSAVDTARVAVDGPLLDVARVDRCRPLSDKYEGKSRFSCVLESGTALSRQFANWDCNFLANCLSFVKGRYVYVGDAVNDQSSDKSEAQKFIL